MITAKRIALVAAALVLGSGVCAAEEKGKVHEVAKDGKAVVISFDNQGGMIRRTSDEPVLVVLADGTVKAGNPWGQGRAVEGKLGGEEMQALLRFILDEEKLGEIKPEDLRMKGGAVVMDGTETKLSVEADGEKKVLSGGAVEQVAEQAGADSAAARFVVISQRLYRLANVTKLGGAEGMKKILEAVNGELKANHPADGQMTEEDLRRAVALKDGGSQAFFSHIIEKGKKAIQSVKVTVDVTKGGEMKVKVESWAMEGK